jgi:hypothetical protein
MDTGLWNCLVLEMGKTSSLWPKNTFDKPARKHSATTYFMSNSKWDQKEEIWTTFVMRSPFSFVISKK